MRRISSFRMWSRLDTPRVPRSILISVVAIFLLLVTFIAQHSFPYARDGLTMASYTFALSLGESSGQTILRSIFSGMTMQPAREGPRLCRRCHLYLSPIPGTWNGQHSSVLLHSVSLATGFPLLADVQSLPQWSSDICPGFGYCKSNHNHNHIYNPNTNLPLSLCLNLIPPYPDLNTILTPTPTITPNVTLTLTQTLTNTHTIILNPNPPTLDSWKSSITVCVHGHEWRMTVCVPRKNDAFGVDCQKRS